MNSGTQPQKINREDQPSEHQDILADDNSIKEEQIKFLKNEIETQTRLLNEKSLAFIADFQEVRYQHQTCSFFSFRRKKELDQKMQALCYDMINFRIPIEKELKKLKGELKYLGG